MSVTNRIVHVVFAPTGPIAAYFNPELAHAHARTMLGVDVGTCQLHGDPLDLSFSRMIRVVFTPAGPIAAFYLHDDAGETVFEGAEITNCELRYDLPEFVREDLHVDYDEEDATPVVGVVAGEIDTDD